MRVPTNRLQRNMAYTLNHSLARIQRRQIEIATGKRIQKPSDDPAGTVRAMSLRSLLADNARYSSNVQDGLYWVSATEEPINSVMELLNKLKETAVSAADDATEDRTFMGAIVDDVLSGLVNQSRAKVNGKYVFSGFRTDTAPYTTSNTVTDDLFTAAAAGTASDVTHARIASGSMSVTDLAGTVIYTEGVDYSVDYQTGRITALSGGALVEGTSYYASYTTETVSSVTAISGIEGDIVRQIDSDRTLTVNLKAPEVFQSGTDVFQLAIDLKNALWKDDPDAVRTVMDNIDTAIDHMSEQLGLIGTRAETLDRNQALLDNNQISLKQFLSEVEDSDLTEAVLQLQTDQAAYEAALASTARLLQLSMVNYI